MNENVTLIPARRRAGNRIIKEEKPKHRVAAYVELVLTAMSRLEVTKCR